VVLDSCSTAREFSYDGILYLYNQINIIHTIVYTHQSNLFVTDNIRTEEEAIIRSASNIMKQINVAVKTNDQICHVWNVTVARTLEEPLLEKQYNYEQQWWQLIIIQQYVINVYIELQREIKANRLGKTIHFNSLQFFILTCKLNSYRSQLQSQNKKIK
jgi:hypothetical protein